MVRRLCHENHQSIINMRRLVFDRPDQVQKIFMHQLLQLTSNLAGHLLLGLPERRQIDDGDQLKSLCSVFAFFLVVMVSVGG